MDQIWFNTSDKHAKTKAFNGIEVNKTKKRNKLLIIKSYIH